jgi:uncharacterized protein GlcG (DUF336 family)
MIRSIAIAATAALIEFTMTGMGFAQQGGQPPPARGLDTALAVEAAQTAVNSCLDSGVKGSAAVVDSAGVLRVLISANGSSKNSAELSPKKAVLANDMKKATSEIFSEMGKDPALKAKLEADKNIFPRPGAVPIMAGNDVIGAIGSCLISCTQSEPGGGWAARVRMQGSMKPLGRAVTMPSLTGSSLPPGTVTVSQNCSAAGGDRW